MIVKDDLRDVQSRHMHINIIYVFDENREFALDWHFAIYQNMTEE